MLKYAVQIKVLCLIMFWCLESANLHTLVPQSVHIEAEEFAKRAMEEADDLDEEVGML